jgi:hypothetical protein
MLVGIASKGKHPTTTRFGSHAKPCQAKRQARVCIRACLRFASGNSNWDAKRTSHVANRRPVFTPAHADSSLGRFYSTRPVSFLHWAGRSGTSASLPYSVLSAQFLILLRFRSSSFPLPV